MNGSRTDRGIGEHWGGVGDLVCWCWRDPACACRGTEWKKGGRESGKRLMLSGLIQKKIDEVGQMAGFVSL